MKDYKGIIVLVILITFIVSLHFLQGFRIKDIEQKSAHRQWAEKAHKEIDERYSSQEYGYYETDCSCSNHIGGTYIKPYYYFTCAKCGKIHTNTDCKTTEEFYTLVKFKE